MSPEVNSLSVLDHIKIQITSLRFVLFFNLKYNKHNTLIRI
jgi:hypothetical protein